MRRVTNDDKMSPMSVIYNGNTYVIPPGETVVLGEVKPAKPTAEAPKPAPIQEIPDPAPQTDGEKKPATNAPRKRKASKGGSK